MKALKPSLVNAAATAPGSTKFSTVLVLARKITSRWLAALDSMGSMFPVTGFGALAALETITVLPSGETASTFPLLGATRVGVLVAVSSDTRPAVVPKNALAPFGVITSEFGGPGRLIAVPTLLLVVSMGTIVEKLPLGGAKVVLA